MRHFARSLRYGAIGLFLVLLAVGPFLKGLFFWTALLAGIAVIGGSFALWLIGRRLSDAPAAVTGGVPGLALLALLACYLLQFAWAVYPRGNLDWVLRVVAAWAVYAMVRAEAGPMLRRVLSWTFVLSAVAMAVPGFLEFTGYMAKNPEMVKALGLVNLSDRMYTPLQYPNTAAAYLLAALFVALGLALEDLRPWKVVAATGLATFLSLAFFFTISRGAVVVLPFGLLLLFLGLEQGKRWPALLLLLVAWTPVLATVKLIGDYSVGHHWLRASAVVAAATLAGMVASLVITYFLRLKFRTQALAVAAVLVVGLGGLLALRPSGGLLPKQAARLLDMNFKTANVIYRLTLDQDALKLIADRPLGRGGWGWERSYRQVQTYYYVGRETHDHYLQTAVEAGIPGLVALLVAMGSALWIAWRNRHENTLGWTLAAGAGLIAGHSLIDFNLSYGLVWFALWALLAAASPPLPAAVWKRPVPWGITAVGVGTAALAGILSLGSWYADQAAVLTEAKQPAAARSDALKAIRFDLLNSAPLLVLDDVPSLQRAERLDPQLADPHFELAIQLNNRRDFEGALQEARLARQCFPLLSAHYTKVADIAGNLMVDALHNGDLTKARSLADELFRLGTDFQRRRALEVGAKGPQMGPVLKMEPAFQLRYGQALYLKGDPNGAIPYLTAASKVGLLGSEGQLWLYAIYERQGNSKGKAELADKPWVRFRNANPVYKQLRDWRP